MTLREEHLACPFCGSHEITQELLRTNNEPTSLIRCKNCYASAPINQWNFRADLSPVLPGK